MNRESLLEMSVGIAIGLIVVVVAAFRSMKKPSAGVLRRSTMLALLTYAVIAVPIFTPSGMTVLGLIALLAIVGLALGGSLLARQYAWGPDHQAFLLIRAVAGTGLAAVVLIATGQTLALVGRVDPRITVIVIAGIAGLLVAGQGMVASARISSLTMWLLTIPVLIALALGFLLGNVSVVFSPILLVDGAPYAAILGVAVAIAFLGFCDNSLVMSNRASSWSPIRVLAWALLVVILVLFGLLMFLGGAIFAPSMEFFVVPSNIDALPGLAGVLMAVMTVLFAALVANTLAGVGGIAEPAQPPVDDTVAASVGDSEEAEQAKSLGLTVRASWVYASALVAALIALADPGAQRVLLATALVATAIAGAQASRGDRRVASLAGVGAAVVCVVVLALVGHLEFGWWSLVATAAVFVVALVAGRLNGSPVDVSTAESSPQSVS